jgi:hypothetical protein
MSMDDDLQIQITHDGVICEFPEFNFTLELTEPIPPPVNEYDIPDPAAVPDGYVLGFVNGEYAPQNPTAVGNIDGGTFF